MRRFGLRFASGFVTVHRFIRCVLSQRFRVKRRARVAPFRVPLLRIISVLRPITVVSPTQTRLVPNRCRQMMIGRRRIVPIDVMADAFHFDVELGLDGILDVVRRNI